MSLSQEPPHSLKRDHDSFDFESLIDLEKPFTVPQDVSPYSSQKQDPDLDSGESSMPTPPVSVGTNKVDPSPARSRSASLTDAGSATPSLRGGSPMPGLEMTRSGQQRIGGSPSPSAFAALNGNGTAPPPAKKPKLSFAEREAEKEMKRIQKEIKDRERAEEKARKEQERQAQAEDKARRDAEREAEKKKKEAEREQKRISQEAEKAAKEEKRRRKEEEKAEKQRAEEAKRKKDGTQLSLGSFFNIPASTAARRSSVDRRSESPAPPSMLAVGVASPAASTPSKKPEQTPYEKMFLDFFVMKEVTMAPINRFERDEEASESLQSMIDSYIVGNRSPGRQRQFDAVNLFHLSGYEKVRGKRCMPVREIMAEMSGKSTRPIDLTTDSQNTQIRRTNDLLRRIPLKFLKFQEDVRPPYRGTYTSRPINGIAKLARNPLRRDLPDTNYDYDSEAEWVEDEDAEDLNSEGDEDEDLGEDGEDMEGFLDDEDDETTHSKRLVLQGDLEPVSTGLCWEDQRKRNTNVKMMPYRMEIILGKLLTLHS
jgi:chromatin assembly factor 1 subunit A